MDIPGAFMLTCFKLKPAKSRVFFIEYGSLPVAALTFELKCCMCFFAFQPVCEVNYL